MKNVSKLVAGLVLALGVTSSMTAYAQSSDRAGALQSSQTQNIQQPATSASKTKPQPQTSAIQNDVKSAGGVAVKSMGPERDKNPELMMDYEARRNGIRE